MPHAAFAVPMIASATRAVAAALRHRRARRTSTPSKPAAPPAAATAPAGVAGSNVAHWLMPGRIELEVDVHDRLQAVREIAALAERTCGLSAPVVFRALWRRELAGSTGVGCGVAIPHARIAGIPQPVTLYLRTRAAVSFAAPDGKPVSDLFVILVPDDGALERNLLLLAATAEAFSDRGFRDRLAAASTVEQVAAVFARQIDEQPTEGCERSAA